jgi:hypothetical protein
MKIRKTYLRVVSVVLLFKASAMACAPSSPMPFLDRLRRQTTNESQSRFSTAWSG